jgi:hypothetical protein
MVPQSSTFDYPIFAHANVVGAKSKSAEIILQFESKRRHTVSNIFSQQSAEARAQATCSSAAQPVQERRATEKTTRFDSEEFQRSLSRKKGRQQKKKKILPLRALFTENIAEEKKIAAYCPEL